MTVDNTHELIMCRGKVVCLQCRDKGYQLLAPCIGHPAWDDASDEDKKQRLDLRTIGTIRNNMESELTTNSPPSMEIITVGPNGKFEITVTDRKKATATRHSIPFHREDFDNDLLLELAIEVIYLRSMIDEIAK